MINNFAPAAAVQVRSQVTGPDKALEAAPAALVASASPRAYTVLPTLNAIAAMSVRDRASMSGEFPKNPPGQALRDRLEAGRRIAQSCVTNVFGDSANNAAMATSLGTVLAIGVYEGALLTRPGALGRARFCFRYGAAQVLPSVIWLTKPARTCCEAWRVEAKPLLREVSPRRELKVLGAQTLRSIVAGFLGIAQVMRLVDSSAAAASDYDERVRNGHEPLFETGVQERVVRLAGRESDVTELSVCLLYTSDAADD